MTTQVAPGDFKRAWEQLGPEQEVMERFQLQVHTHTHTHTHSKSPFYAGALFFVCVMVVSLCRVCMYVCLSVCGF